MDDKKVVALLGQVLQKTRSGKLRWEPTAKEDEFFAIHGDFTITICRMPLHPTSEVRVEELALVLREQDQELLHITPSTTEGVTSAALEELDQLARRQAFGVDTKLDKLLGELARL